MSILDRITPSEAHLPSSARTWARTIILPGGWAALELRDPNSGVGWDPATKPRHQYLVRRGRLWGRRLPPAPLDQPTDETPWADETGPPRWRLADLLPGGLVTEWAIEDEGLPEEALLARTVPVVATVERDIHGDGGGEYEAYIMPPADPWDVWADITGVPCPVEGCEQTLVWWEAGYVPGYRVCMTPLEARYDRHTIRHRFVLDHSREFPGSVLIREHDRR